MPEDLNGFSVNPTQLPPRTGPAMLHEEVQDLRAQVTQLADANMQLAQRVEVLEAARRQNPVAITVVHDWED